MTKRVAIYCRVSTTHQKTDNQEQELREVAGRSGYEVVKDYRDHGRHQSRGACPYRYPLFRDMR